MRSERITLHEIKCPNCGAPISCFNPYSATCRCPNCDKIFQVIGGTHSAPNLPVPERYFPFTQSEEAFLDRFNHVFWQEHSPKFGEEVRTTAVFSEVCSFYVSAYVFPEPVSFFSSFSISGTVGEQSFFEQQSSFSSSITNLDTSGKIENPVPALDDVHIPYGAKECIDEFRYDSKRARFFNPAAPSCGNYPILPPEIPVSFAWEKFYPSFCSISEKKMDEVIRQAHAAGRIPIPQNINISGISDLRISVPTMCPHNALCILIPLRRITFTFDNKTYYFISDGSGMITKWSFPPDYVLNEARRRERNAALLAQKRKREQQEKENKANLILGFIIVIVVCVAIALVWIWLNEIAAFLLLLAVFGFIKALTGSK